MILDFGNLAIRCKIEKAGSTHDGRIWRDSFGYLVNFAIAIFGHALDRVAC
jgi:hypothetical protein